MNLLQFRAFDVFKHLFHQAVLRLVVLILVGLLILVIVCRDVVVRDAGAVGILLEQPCDYPIFVALLKTTSVFISMKRRLLRLIPGISLFGIGLLRALAHASLIAILLLRNHFVVIVLPQFLSAA